MSCRWLRNWIIAVVVDDIMRNGRIRRALEFKSKPLFLLKTGTNGDISRVEVRDVEGMILQDTK
jgi:hypothetical protein